MLAKIIKDKIAKKNKAEQTICFDEFMQEALYHNHYGYYRSHSPKLGVSGDFITAPETSDLFGFCVARQVQQIGGNILEFGAGSGALAAQILTYLQQQNALPKVYYILELSNSLKERQKYNIFSVLPEIKTKIIWLDKLPKDFDGVVIANEVLDAMPTKRAIIKDNYFYELGVKIKDDNFDWQILLSKINNKKYNLVDGYISEFNLQNLAWISSLYDCLKNATVLLIDYGLSEREFFHQDRFMGTLRCYKNHKADDNPFIDIGNKDITSWVNFSSVANKAQQVGFEVLGYATQAMFLISLGIEEFLLDEKDEGRKIQLANEVKQLIMPGAMGESFKVLALSKNSTNKSIKLRGFYEQNLVQKL